MGKALLVGVPADVATGRESNFFGGVDVLTESNAHVIATEAMTFSNMGVRITAGGSGTNTCRFRNNSADGNQVTAFAGTGTAEDSSNTDTVAAGDEFNVTMTDTGTDPTYAWIKCNIELASGHGSIHVGANPAGQLFDLTASTRTIPINGRTSADGESQAAEAQVAWKVREYDSIESFQVNVQSNVRVNDSTFRLRINGSPVGTAITYGAGVAGIQTVTGAGISVSPGDTVSFALTLGAGGEDLFLNNVGVLFKSSTGGSEIATGNAAGIARTASATPTYYAVGGDLIANATESNVSIKPGFAAICRNLRCYLTTNTYTADATLKLFVNGAEEISLTLTAGAASQWFENASDTFTIDDNDVISFEIVGGTSGSISIHQIGVSFGSASDDVTGTIAQTLPKVTQAATGTAILDASGTVAQTLPKVTQAAAGTVTSDGVAGAIAQTLPKVTQAATGTVILDVTGTIAQILPMVTQAASGTVTAPDPDAPIDPPTIAAENCEVYNLDTGRRYYAKAADTSQIGASTAKMMTAYILLREKPTLADLEQTVTITAADLTAAGTGNNIAENDVISLYNLLANAMLPSSNNSCMAIARTIGDELSGGGGVARFVTEMNTVAASLGMNGTVYEDPHGNSDQITTARDTSNVFGEMCENEILKRIWRLASYRMPVDRGGPTTVLITQTNILHAAIGVRGGKTGSFPSENVYNVEVAWEAPNGQMLVACVLGAPTAEDRFTDMQAILAQLPIDFPELAVCASPWTPQYMKDDIGCGGGWWDASDLTTQYQTEDTSTPVTAATQAVGRVENKFGGSAAFTQSTANARPTLQNSGDDWWWQGDGTNDFLTLGTGTIDATSLFAATGQQFMIGIKAKTADGTAATFLARAGATAGDRTLQIYMDTGDTPGGYLRGGNFSPADGLNDDVIHGFGSWWDEEYGTLVRGDLGAGQIAVGAAAEEASQHIVLFSRTNGTASFLDGDIYEVVIADAYDADHQRRMHDYMQGGVVNAFRDPTGGEASGASDERPHLVFGMGPAGKQWAHPWPSFSRTAA